MKSIKVPKVPFISNNANTFVDQSKKYSNKTLKDKSHGFQIET